MPTEMILSPDYWKGRLKVVQEAGLPQHHAIFKIAEGAWRFIEEKHREILAYRIGPDQSVLDCGCGWGRLLTLMPANWKGDYLGIDISPDFIALAEKEHSDFLFKVGDLRDAEALAMGQQFDWAVMISIRPMVKRHTGIWPECEAAIRKVAKKLLYLEYDPLDEGSVE